MRVDVFLDRIHILTDDSSAEELATAREQDVCASGKTSMWPISAVSVQQDI